MEAQGRRGIARGEDADDESSELEEQGKRIPREDSDEKAPEVEEQGLKRPREDAAEVEEQGTEQEGNRRP